MKRYLFIIFLFFIIFSFFSCEFSSINLKSDETNSSSQTTPLPNFRYDDLPIPNNFTLIGDESFSYEADKFRTGILKYQAKDDYKNVANFFKGELPKYNWNLVSSIEFQNILQLIFEKDSWISVISIKQKSSKTFLSIAIGPKSK